MTTYPTRGAYPSSKPSTPPASPQETAALATSIPTSGVTLTAGPTTAQPATEMKPELVGAPEQAVQAQQEARGYVPEVAQASAATSTSADTVVAPGVTLSVITGHKDSRMAQIIRGTVGSVKNDIFEIDAVYPKIAHLFTLMSASMTGQGTELTEVTLSNQAVAQEFVMNMVASSGDQWDKMYSGFGDDQSNDLAATMIRNERSMVRQNVARVLSESGLRSFDIPVQYESFVSQPDDDQTAEECNLFTEIDLARAGLKLQSSVARIQDALIEESSDTAPDSPELSADALAHTGAFTLDVKGVASILASSAENAQEIFSALLKISNSTQLQNVLTLQPVSLNNVSLTPYQSNTDYDRDY